MPGFEFQCVLRWGTAPSEKMRNHAYTGPLKAALLDWAGTTMDYGCYAPAVAFVDVYKRRGVEISMEEARIPMGAHKKVHIRKISQIPDVAERWQRINGQACTEEDVESMFQEFVPIQLPCLPDYADLIPGTVETVDAMRERGLKIGSTTGYLPDMMEILQKEARNRGYEPDSTVCAGEGCPCRTPRTVDVSSQCGKARRVPHESHREDRRHAAGHRRGSERWDVDRRPGQDR